MTSEKRAERFSLCRTTAADHKEQVQPSLFTAAERLVLHDQCRQLSSVHRSARRKYILCLPSANTLQKVSRRLSATDGLDNSNYLRLRVSKLDEYESNDN